MSLHEFAVDGHWRDPGVVAMTDTVSSDEEALRKALAQEFGRSLDIARLDIDARVVCDHACRIGEEALSSALWPRAQGQMLPYRLLVGFFESSRLNAGPLDLTNGASLVALSDSFPVALLGVTSPLHQQSGISRARKNGLVCGLKSPGCRWIAVDRHRTSKRGKVLVWQRLADYLGLLRKSAE